MPERCFCALCGVGFNIYNTEGRIGFNSDTAWTWYYRLLTKRQRSPDSETDVEWCMSGVGWDYAGWYERGLHPRSAYVPPEDYDDRKYDKKELAYRSRRLTSRWRRVALYSFIPTDQDPGPQRAIPFHAACWDFLIQAEAQAALGLTAGPDLRGLGYFLSSPNFKDDHQELRINWAQDFGGTERFWSDKDAIAMMGVKPEEVLETCDWVRELEFLVMNPDHFEDVGGGFLTPPRATPGNAPPILEASTRTPCCFSQLPEELLFQIIFLLPTASVNAVRLASRATAAVHLTKIYWKSRFEHPNELSHIKLPSALWAGHTDGLPVDWKKFCQRLLNPESMDWKDDIFWRADMFAMDRYIECGRNRRRITNLSRKLLERIAQESRNAC